MSICARNSRDFVSFKNYKYEIKIRGEKKWIKR